LRDQLRARFKEFDNLIDTDDETELDLIHDLFADDDDTIEEENTNEEEEEPSKPNTILLSQEESYILTDHLEGLSASELAGYVSCLVSDRRSNTLGIAESFQELTPGQRNAVQSAMAMSERLLDVQRGCSNSLRNTQCELDLSIANVVTAWAEGCTWSEALELSSSNAPGDLVRMLNRVMDALRQFGNLPYNPIRRSEFYYNDDDVNDVLIRSSCPGISTKIRNLCRDAARAMNRYPVKDPLPFDTESSEVDEEFEEKTETDDEEENDDTVLNDDDNVVEEENDDTVLLNDNDNVEVEKEEKEEI